MDLKLTNQVAVVIGGASGIGLATAQAFAAEGAPVAILEGIDSARVRFRDKQGVWQTDWRPQRTDELPIAIELTLVQTGNAARPLTLQFLVAGGGA